MKCEAAKIVGEFLLKFGKNESEDEMLFAEVSNSIVMGSLYSLLYAYIITHKKYGNKTVYENEKRK